MAAFDSILKASIGSTSFQLMDYSVRETPVTKDGLGQTGTKVTVQGDGWVEAADAASLTAAIAAMLAGFRIVGKNVTITGLGGAVEYQLLAASCVDGGPFVEIEIQLQQQRGEALVKPVRFTANGSTAPSGGTTNLVDQFKVETTTRPDELRGITYSGEVLGPGAVGQYVDGILPALLAQYPDSDWTHSDKFSTNAKQDKVDWQVTFVELAAPLPDAVDATAVDGEGTIRREGDEQMRLVTEIGFDLLVEGDPTALLTSIRPTEGVILKESSEITQFRERRLRASFTTLSGRDGNDLLNWEQTLEHEKEVTPLRVVTYPNGEPVFILDVQPAYVTQRGRAIGAGQYPQAPEPFWPDQLVDRPKIIHTPLNAAEFQVEWMYRFVFRTAPDAAAQVALLARPGSPEFE